MTAPEGLVAALARAQADFGPIHKGRTAKVPTKAGGSYEYSYADLGDVLAAVRPVLAKHGVAVVQATEETEHGTVLVTRLLYGDECQEGRLLLPVGQNATAQQIGSAFTYARRYALCSMVGVAAEDDDDGQAAQAAPKPKPQRRNSGSGRSNPSVNNDGEPLATKTQQAQFVALCDHLGFDRGDRADFVQQTVGRAAWKDVTKADADQLLAELKGREGLDVFERADGGWGVVPAGAEPFDEVVSS